MSPNLTNLLPEDRIRQNRRLYFVRLAVVCAVLLMVLVGIHGLLLFPSYAYVSSEVQSRTTELAGLTTTPASVQGQTAQQQLNALNTQAKYLGRMQGIPTASQAVGLVLGVPRPGITISGIEYVSGSGTNPRKIVLEGTAATRNTLHDYVTALQALPWITNVDLPLSDYANDTDINFSVTLTGSFVAS